MHLFLSLGQTPLLFMICENPDLADVDVEMDRLYRGALRGADVNQRTALKSAQTAWLSERDHSCGAYKGTRGADCLREKYSKRIEELEKGR